MGGGVWQADLSGGDRPSREAPLFPSPLLTHPPTHPASEEQRQQERAPAAACQGGPVMGEPGETADGAVGASEGLKRFG